MKACIRLQQKVVHKSIKQREGWKKYFFIACDIEVDLNDEDYAWSNNWDDVTCLKCKRKRINQK